MLSNAVLSAKARRLRNIVAAFVCVLMFALLLRLGFWQLERADYKEDLAAQVQSNSKHEISKPHEILSSSPDAAWSFRRVQIVGHFDRTRQYLLDNRTSNGRAGYHVLSVFRYGDFNVLVNRGWVPVGDDRRVLPSIGVDDQQIVLNGRLAPLPGSGLSLGESGYDEKNWPKVVQRVELEVMQRQLEVPLLATVLLLDAEHPACLHCQWVAVKGISAQRHRGYAFQWFALAAAFIVLLAAAIFFKGRNDVR